MNLTKTGRIAYALGAINGNKEKVRFFHPIGFVVFILTAIFLWAIPKNRRLEAWNQYTFTW